MITTHGSRAANSDFSNGVYESLNGVHLGYILFTNGVYFLGTFFRSEIEDSIRKTTIINVFVEDKTMCRYLYSYTSFVANSSQEILC